MERRVIVLRHAKSSWKTDAGDHDRPLNKRGQRDAPAVAARLAELGWSPERVISSDATRTRETWGLMADAFDPAPEVTFTPELYLAGPEEVANALTGLSDDVTTVMVVGHNDGWEQVVTWLSDACEAMTTCNAALLSVEADCWAEAIFLAPGWTLHDVVRPKEL